MNDFKATTNIINRMLEQIDAKLFGKTEDVERFLFRQHKAVLESIKRQIADLFVKVERSALQGEVNYTALNKFKWFKQMLRSIGNEINSLMQDDKKGIKAGLREFYKESFKDTIDVFNKTTDVNLSFAVLQSEAIKRAAKNEFGKVQWDDNLVKHKDRYIQTLKEEITRGLIAGKSYQAITDKVIDKSNIYATKVRRIVRTETHRVTNEARLDGFKTVNQAAEDLGFKAKRVWLSKIDNRTRDTHIHLNNQLENEEGIWITDIGTHLKAPGVIASGSPDNPEDVINCRCSVKTKLTSA